MDIKYALPFFFYEGIQVKSSTRARVNVLWQRSDKGLIDPGPIFSCNIFSWLFRIHHDIGKFHSKITQRKALWLSPFTLVCPPFIDYSIAGHNILPALNSTVSCRWQTLRQKENKFVLLDAHGLHVFQWYHLISTIEYAHGPHVFQWYQFHEHNRIIYRFRQA